MRVLRLIDGEYCQQYSLSQPSTSRILLLGSARHRRYFSQKHAGSSERQAIKKRRARHGQRRALCRFTRGDFRKGEIMTSQQVAVAAFIHEDGKALLPKRAQDKAVAPGLCHLPV